MADQQFSLLSGEEIKSFDPTIVTNGNDELYRASTYDLSVGDIIPAGPDARPASESYILPPGGTVRVVSNESLKLPEGITGHVLLKNGLCNKGILAIHIGIVDPGFEGPISSTLINFGRAGFEVKKSMPFLRVSFLRSTPSPKAKDSKKYTRPEYLEETKQQVLAYSASTFLDIESTAKKAADNVFGSFKTTLAFWTAVAAVGFALITIFVPWGASYVDKYLAGREQHEAQMEQVLEKKIEERYELRLKALQDQVEELQRARQLKPKSGAAPSARH